MSGKAFSWNDLPRIMQKWKTMSGNKSFLVKGIQSVDDAKKAVLLGVDGVVFHMFPVFQAATTQADKLMELSAPLTFCPTIFQMATARARLMRAPQTAVGDKTTILFDSGIRGGADVFKALALGAKAVLIGRLWIYGMGIAGEEGVRHVMKSLLADFDILQVPFRHRGCQAHRS
ncbi:hypothetical protein QFC20_003162 [Naganishia adeliensis]|uniref:Uncharacterized protein n=1 Tax=Naganishia adeliensis TaxID=92952 RepID=A0ACC2WFW6_9TREE|nr:hypothetical protein QFC20_003162 [Naganishia adeliensis]